VLYLVGGGARVGKGGMLGVAKLLAVGRGLVVLGMMVVVRQATTYVSGTGDAGKVSLQSRDSTGRHEHARAGVGGRGTRFGAVGDRGALRRTLKHNNNRNKVSQKSFSHTRYIPPWTMDTKMVHFLHSLWVDLKA
jgi:hypothetical protein